MSDNTKIEWADATVNAVNGCSVVSPGCTNCYAMRLAGTRLKNHPSRPGLTTASKAGPVWNGTIHVNEAAMLQPLSWKRPRTIFWNAHGDLFHDAVPDAVIDRCFAVMALTPHHTHQVLTKRSDRMREYCRSLPNRDDIIVETARKAGATLMSCRDVGARVRGGMENMDHIHLGVSVEDQTRADQRIPDLLATPAAVRFLSCEPLLGRLDLTEVCNGHYFQNPLTGQRWHDAPDGVASANDMSGSRIDWVIAGGESGPGARPMHPDWARSLRDQCADAGVPFFFKQWGEWAPHPSGEPVTIRQYHNQIGYIDRDTGERKRNPNRHTDETMRRIGKKRAGRLLDGVTHDGRPA